MAERRQLDLINFVSVLGKFPSIHSSSTGPEKGAAAEVLDGALSLRPTPNPLGTVGVILASSLPSPSQPAHILASFLLDCNSSCHRSHGNEKSHRILMGPRIRSLGRSVQVSVVPISSSLLLDCGWLQYPLSVSHKQRKCFSFGRSCCGQDLYCLSIEVIHF